MDPAKLLRTRFWLVTATSVAAAAYLQATGVSALIASSLAPESATLARGRAVRGAGPAGQAVARRTGKPILERNPFDSVTGPLTGDPNAAEPEPEVKRYGVDDPLGAPMCSDIEVHGTTVASDPHWSLAVVQVKGQPHGSLRRIGDAVADRQVAYIGFNRRKMSPAVWFENDTGLCQSLVFSKARAPAKPPSKARKPPPKKNVKRRGPPPLPKKIADKIQKIGPTEFNVDRSAIDQILEQHAQLMKSARVMPVQKNGRVAGIRVVNIRPDTLLGKLGFQNGDQIDNINGFALSSPEKALQAYARLRTAPNISVKVERHGKPISIDFHVK